MKSSQKLYTFTTYQAWEALVWLNPVLKRESDETWNGLVQFERYRTPQGCVHEEALELFLDLQVQIALPALISGTSQRIGIMCFELWKEDLIPYLSKID